jgi:tRNA/rRNA methyltransferase
MGERRPAIEKWCEDLRPAPAIVLVEPQMGENIGAAARAMCNFGLADMRIVNPRDGWPNDKAIAMAAGAAPVVEAAKVFLTTAEALADCTFVVATTARARELMLPVFSPEVAASEMRPRISAGGQCAVLFGPERAGLNTDDVMKADALISIPVNPAFASLNLAQAVLIIAYEWAKADGREGYASDLDYAEAVTKADFQKLTAHLFSELEKTNYFFPAGRGEAKKRALISILARAQLTAGEARTLRGMIKALGRRE